MTVSCPLVDFLYYHYTYKWGDNREQVEGLFTKGGFGCGFAECSGAYLGEEIGHGYGAGQGSCDGVWTDSGFQSECLKREQT